MLDAKQSKGKQKESIKNTDSTAPGPQPQVVRWRFALSTKPEAPLAVPTNQLIFDPFLIPCMQHGVHRQE